MGEAMGNAMCRVEYIYLPPNRGGGVERWCAIIAHYATVFTYIFTICAGTGAPGGQVALARMRVCFSL